MKTSCTTSTNKDSDGALLAAAKRGDTQAFEELVFRHQQRVLAVAQRITNNREDAEDVAQEGFQVRGKILAGVKPTPDLQKESTLECSA
jgi:hypothetical protein